jgi:hypothetical protein
MKRLLMNLSFYAAALMTLACAFSGTTMAQSAQPAQPVKGTNDPFGAVPDTVYAEINRIDKSNWSVTITVFNDAPLAGLQIPLRYKGGNIQLVADSAVFSGSRVSDWDMNGFRCDTAIQALRLMMIANIGPTQKKLIPGSGRVATIFISSLEDEPVENLIIDTTTISDLNLLFVADINQTKNGKPVTVDPAKREIRPAWVVRKRDH